MYELLLWLDLESALSINHLNHQESQPLRSLLESAGLTVGLLSSAILACYLFSFATNKKPVYILVYLFSEFIGVSFVLDSLSNINFYLCYASVYCLLYLHMRKSKVDFEIIKGCVAVICLDIGNIINAASYPDIETYFYIHYELMFVLAHIYFISKITNYTKLQRIMGDTLDHLLGLLSYNYNARYICYNIEKAINQDKT